MSRHYLFICSIFLAVAVPASHGDGGAVDDQLNYTSCATSHACGALVTDIPYPFWGNNIRPQYCGRHGFELQCYDNECATIRMGAAQSLQILRIDNPRQIMTVARPEFLRGDYHCRIIFQEISISNGTTLFSYGDNVRNLSLYFDCSEPLSYHLGKNNFSCPMEDGVVVESFYRFDDRDDSRFPNLSRSCSKVIKIAIENTLLHLRYLSEGKLIEVMNQGFEVRYSSDNESCSECLASGGICGSNQSSDEFLCLCPDQLHGRVCSLPPGSSPDVIFKVGLGLGIAILGIIFIFVIFCIWRRKRNSSIISTLSFRNVSKSDRDLEAFIRNYGPLAPKRYSFLDVRKMTNSFQDGIGQGGYGSVYKGKLPDGRLVAVKLLNASKGKGQEFINEVASISKTSHVNVVTLLGFCLEGNNRALVYEFMPNGSLEKFIYNGDKSEPSRQYMGWDKMYEIVVGIARGLEYLHRGCNTRILHLDIKPHNILLDKDFVPKISDFGLAKLCREKESIVSIMEARGTFGYIAPEVFSRSFGEVSHKSDVYSYGMMIMELVGCRNNSPSGTDHSSEIYFPDRVYQHVEQGEEIELPGVVTTEESKIVRKMILVGLWCIQTRPSDRPPMTRVIEMLHGSVEALETPPMPSLSSAPRPPTCSSTISTY